MFSPGSSLFKAHAAWLIENDKFQHSSQTVYGENLFRIKWKTYLNPSEGDKLSISSVAVEQWYKEYLNFNRTSCKWNGNIYHKEQIGHFLQVSFKLKYERKLTIIS